MRRIPLVLSCLSCLSCLAVAACGGGGAGTAPPAGPAAGGPGGTAPAAAGGQGAGSGVSAARLSTVMAGTVSLTGPVTVSGPFRVVPSAHLPCTTLAQAGSSGIFAVPSPGLVNSSTVDVSIAISSYHGPGTYGIDSLRSSSAAITVNHDRYTLTGPGATASLTVQPDASGRLSLSHLSGPKQPLSGTLTWTCQSSQPTSSPQGQGGGATQGAGTTQP
jgi:hypothetical protein